MAPRQSSEQKRLSEVRAKLREQVLHADNHYEVLGVPPGAPVDVIRSTHRYLAGAFHPDRCLLADAHELMAKVNVAYTCLTDTAARRRYDTANKTHQDVCLTCRGQGTVQKQKGFKAKVTVTCPACKGSGCQ